MKSSQIIVTNLKRVKLDAGDVLHGLKKSDPEYKCFGEAYFSKIEYREIKAWKLHKRMTLNLIVPSGSVKFAFFDKNFNKLTSLVVGDENYSRVTVPPGIWFGFMGIGSGLNLILNIADIEHDPNEVERMSRSELDFDWSEA